MPDPAIATAIETMDTGARRIHARGKRDIRSSLTLRFSKTTRRPRFGRDSPRPVERTYMHVGPSRA